MAIVDRATIVVDVDSSMADAAFRKMQADAARTMAAIDRERATATIDANSRPLDRAVAETEAKLAALNKEKVEIELEIDKDGDAQARLKGINKEMKELSANKRVLASQKSMYAKDAAALADLNKQKAITAKRDAAMSKQHLADLRFQKQMETATRRTAEARAKEIDTNLNNSVALAQMRKRYAAVKGEQEQLSRSFRGLGGRTRTARRDFDLVTAEAAKLEHGIKKLGGSVKDITPHLERHEGALGRWANSLASVRIQMGFFSATLRQVGFGLVALGPVITGLAGGLVSLVGVLGTGLAGGLSVAAAGAAGFTLAAGGMFAVIKPIAAELSLASKATEAYTKAVIKYGKGSDQAKTAQEQMSNTLKNISPDTARVAKSWAEIKGTFGELTKGARGSVFNGINEGLKTTKALLPQFASETVKTTKAASQAWSGWMKSLRSSEAKQILGDIMGNFRASIPGIADGLGSIGAAFGRIAQSASKLLPDLSKGFADWANKIEKGVGGGQGLDSGMERLVGHMKDLGHLAQSTGSFLTHFFNASADSGDNLVQTLDGVMKKWDAWTQSKGGKKSLTDFFSEAATETKQFFSAMAPLTQTIFAMGRAFAPLSGGATKLLQVFGEITAFAAKFAPLHIALEGIGAALAAMWAGGKIKSIASAFTGLFGGGASAAGTAAYTAALEANTAALVANAGAATADAAALEGVALAEGEAAGGAGLLAGLMAPEILIPAALVGGLIGLSILLGDSKSDFEQAAEAAKEYGHKLEGATKGTTVASDKFSASLTKQKNTRKELNAVEAQIHKAGGKAPLALLEKQVALEHQQAATRRQSGESSAMTMRAATAQARSAKAQISSYEEAIKAAKMEQKVAGGMNRFGVKDADKAAAATKNLTTAEKGLAKAHAMVSQAEHALTMAGIPRERFYKKMKPLTDQTREGLEKLSHTIGDVATKKIGNFVDPKQVAQITNLSNRLTKLGLGKIVKRVDVKSQGGDETLAKLQRVKQQAQAISGQKVRLNATANTEGAKTKLSSLSKLSQRVTGGKNTIRILANSQNAEQAITRVRASLERTVRRRFEAKITAIDNTKGISNAAKQKLTAIARGKYQAQVSAIDRASHPAKAAEAALKAVGRQKPKPTIEVNNASALNTIHSTEAALRAIPDETVTVTVNEVPGSRVARRAAGGPAIYMASGGEVTQRELINAQRRATPGESGRSQRVNSPRMLVGEQGPRHPEYVIATNPAYRTSNEKYLEQAAAGIGREVVPAYAGGKGGGKPKRQHKKHRKVAKHRFAPKQVGELNQAEGQQGNIERQFNAELQREEQEIQHKKRAGYDFAKLRGFIGLEKSLEDKILNLLPQITSASNNALTRANKQLHGPLSRKEIKHEQKLANAAEHRYQHLKKPKKAKGESEGEYKNKVAGYETQKDKLKAQSKRQKAYVKQLEKERTEFIKVREDANQELQEVRQEIVQEQKSKAFEIDTEEANYAEMEKDATLTPYYNEPNGPGGGAEGPTIGEQTATASAARYDLSRQFSSNVSGSILPGAHGGAGAGSGPGQPSYLPGAPGRYIGGGSPTSTAGAPSGPGGTTIVNNFASPPPDPHTWTQQQQFEVGASI